MVEALKRPPPFLSPFCPLQHFGEGGSPCYPRLSLSLLEGEGEVGTPLEACDERVWEVDVPLGAPWKVSWWLENLPLVEK